VNVDVLEDRGSSYFAKPNEDFLSANDSWFMPVVQKVGPDGCLWVLDWYDRYHCYQDANRDPKGIDRLKGRLYRVRYKNSPRSGRFDLAEESDEQLVRRLESGNIYFRNIAQRLLSERLAKSDRPATRKKLQSIVRGEPTRQSASRVVLPNGGKVDRIDEEHPGMKTRMHGLWALAGAGKLSNEFLWQLLNDEDARLRAWGVRIAGNAKTLPQGTRKQIQELCNDKHPRVLLQAAAAINKIDGTDKVKGLFDVLNSAGNDEVIPRVVWQNLHPHIGADASGFLARLQKDLGTTASGFFPRIVDRVLASPSVGPRQIAELVTALVDNAEETEARSVLKLLAQRAQTGQFTDVETSQLRESLESTFRKIRLKRPPSAIGFDALCTAVSLGETSGAGQLQTWFKSYDAGQNYRLRALAALVQAGEHDLIDAVALVEENMVGPEFSRRILDILGRSTDVDLASTLLEAYPRLNPEVKPQAIELLTSRTAWSRELMAAIDAEKLSASDLNGTQVRKLYANPDNELRQLVTKQWGVLRTRRDPAREELIDRMRRLIRTTKGDPHKGVPVFRKLCAQCHKIYGEGQEVGPDITLNGRNSFEQLLSNVFDPSLVIGNAYQATTIVTDEGKVISGLVSEDSPQRVVLRIEGGKTEIIARDRIDEATKSDLSLMPEGIEKQLKPQEIVDLFAYLTLDKPPTDPTAKRLPGAGLIEFKETQDARRFPGMVAFMLPGFTTRKSGHDGVAIIPNHEGRAAVRVHPISRDEPNVISGSQLVPESGKTSLRLVVGRHPKGDWELLVKINGAVATKVRMNPGTSPNSWRNVVVDLSKYAGKNVRIAIESHDLGRWYYEFAYYARAELVTE